ncbi:hypothetical protein L6R50_25950 [Myxococcota bacterium]|nr:hypothetical protein [Myxococcota bacterium]
MAGILIGQVTVNPGTARPGESVKVEVLGTDGLTLDGRTRVTVTIDGVVGALQYLQFPGECERVLRVRASGGGLVDDATAGVQVAGAMVTFMSTARRVASAESALM